jgi:hypothetical protein
MSLSEAVEETAAGETVPEETVRDSLSGRDSLTGRDSLSGIDSPFGRDSLRAGRDCHWRDGCSGSDSL